ncbi:DUF5333 family protein [Hasllibacter sp. MH4015]|uniref:DUF5333 family protein n=1 Tax=Hasllibacter sp. MH4015 TaxID=2854029 RepID=UPI001CD65F86|nr:DUF5333 family protein [Hasllibacter sp. MH4015]
MRALAVFAGLVTLTGCVAQSTGVQAQFEAFAADASTAEIMDDICPQYRMRQSLEALTDGFIQQMRDAGYSDTEIVQAIEATPESRVVDRVIARMGAEGVTPGDAAALCAYAEREVAANSGIGRLLR